jgi:hypothetical protein
MNSCWRVVVFPAADADQVPSNSTYWVVRGSTVAIDPENPEHCAAVVGTPPDATDSTRHVPLICNVIRLVVNAVIVRYAFRWNGAVIAAVGASAAATATLPDVVPGVGLTFKFTANVAADVVAIVPYASSISARPSGLGTKLTAHPAGIAQTGFVPTTPENAAMVVYVFFVIGTGSV